MPKTPKWILLTNAQTSKRQMVLFGGETGANEFSTVRDEDGDWANLVVYPSGKWLKVLESPSDIYFKEIV